MSPEGKEKGTVSEGEIFEEEAFVRKGDCRRRSKTPHCEIIKYLKTQRRDSSHSASKKLFTPIDMACESHPPVISEPCIPLTLT
uniref:Histone-lysine N-methyltransferase SETMAR n=1 Tax=Steinernema glaseri TaxID=37863 RepID=A0A1I8AJP1_9BILA